MKLACGLHPPHAALRPAPLACGSLGSSNVMHSVCAASGTRTTMCVSITCSIWRGPPPSPRHAAPSTALRPSWQLQCYALGRRACTLNGSAISLNSTHYVTCLPDIIQQIGAPLLAQGSQPPSLSNLSAARQAYILCQDFVGRACILSGSATSWNSVHYVTCLPDIVQQTWQGHLLAGILLARICPEAVVPHALCS